MVCPDPALSPLFVVAWLPFLSVIRVAILLEGCDANGAFAVVAAIGAHTNAASEGDTRSAFTMALAHFTGTPDVAQDTLTQGQGLFILGAPGGLHTFAQGPGFPLSREMRMALLGPCMRMKMASRRPVQKGGRHWRREPEREIALVTYRYV